jgi:hypothetical protein
MNRQTALRACAVLMLLAGGVILSAQQGGAPLQLPSSPPQAFGASVTPAFEGWWDNQDGTHTFLIGYFSRNTQQELDVPIGPNNHFEPGNPDMGQPTHFLPRRHFGMFVINVPKEFAKTQKLTWTLTVAGVTSTVPFHMHTDYNVSSFKSTEESQKGENNRPPTLKFTEAGPSFFGPIGTPTKAVEMKAVVGKPMNLEILAEDDGVHSTGNNAPSMFERPPVTTQVTKWRGPGTVKVESPKLTATKGGKEHEAFAGKGTTTATFSEPGEYMLHVQLNDYSGQGGAGSGCCWTTAIVKVNVTGASTTSGANQ